MLLIRLRKFFTGSSAEAPYGLTRRRLLCGAALSPLRSFRGISILGIAVGSSMTPMAAKAEPITACLAVAAAVASLIAAHNRSDGGMGAVLEATLSYQKLLTSQLLSLQEGMAVVLEKLNSLPDEIRSALEESRLKELQSKLGSSIIRYEIEVRERSPAFDSYQLWVKSPLTISTLTDISLQLEQAAAEVQQNRWIDPMTALYLPAAAFTSLGVRTARGDPIRALEAEAQRWLDLLTMVQDPTQPGSAAAELVMRLANVDQIKIQLRAQSYVVPDGASTAITELALGQLTVHDYTPARLLAVREHCETIGQGDVDKQEHCVNENIYSDARSGDTENFVYYAKISPVFIDSEQPDLPKLSIRQFNVTDVTTRAAPPLPDVVIQFPPGLADPGMGFPGARRFGFTLPPLTIAHPRPILEVEAKTHDARLAASQQTPQFDQARQARQLLADTLQKLNLETARVALCAGALVAASSTQLALFRTFGVEA